jgi:chromosome segregation ATPase
MGESHDEALERGRREGGIDARLDEHARHLATVNGSIDRAAHALEEVAKEVRELSVDFKTQIKMAEAAREALAIETERRRAELEQSTETTDRRFSKRERVVGLAVTVLLGLAGLWIATH